MEQTLSAVQVCKWPIMCMTGPIQTLVHGSFYTTASRTMQSNKTFNALLRHRAQAVPVVHIAGAKKVFRHSKVNHALSADNRQTQLTRQVLVGEHHLITYILGIAVIRQACTTHVAVGSHNTSLYMYVARGAWDRARSEYQRFSLGSFAPCTSTVLRKTIQFTCTSKFSYTTKKATRCVLMRYK